MKYRRMWISILVLVLVVAPMLVQSSSGLAAGRNDPAPLVSADSPTAITGEYIVVFQPGTASMHVNAAERQAKASGGNIHFRYSAALNGFAASLPEQALNGLRHNPNVLYVEADQQIFLDVTQNGATWGIDRIDQRNLPLSTTYSYTVTGAGVTAYIIDTGIRITHTEFGGRASVGTDKVGDGQNGIDCHGHGTHVAGTVGGSTYGVAKGVSLGGRARA